MFPIDAYNMTDDDLAKLDAQQPGMGAVLSQERDRQRQMIAPFADLSPAKPLQDMNLTGVTPDQVAQFDRTPEEKQMILAERERQLANQGQPIDEIPMADSQKVARAAAGIPEPMAPQPDSLGVANPYAQPPIAPQPAAASAAPVGGKPVAGAAGGALGGIAKEAKKDADAADKQYQEGANMRATGMENQVKAQEGLAQAQMQAQSQIQGVLANQHRGLRAAEAEEAVARAKREQAMQRAAWQHEDLKNQVAEMKEDPDRFYKNEDGSTNYGKKIAAAIAIAMGQFGAAMTGGPNAAMQIIEGAIERDIQSQREAIKKARGDVDAQRNFVADLRQKGFDEQSEMQAAKVAYLEDAKRQIDMITQSTKNPEILAKAKEARALMEQRQGELTQEAAKYAGDSAYRTATSQADIEARRQQLGLQREQLDLSREELGAKKAAAGADTQQQVALLRSAGLEPAAGVLPDKEIIKKAQESKGKVSAIRSNLARLIEMRKQYGAETLNRDVVREMRQIATDIQLDYKEVKRLGAVSQDDAKKLDAVITSDPSEIGNVQGQLESFGQMLDRTTSSQFKAWGLREVAQGAPRGGQGM